jgi:hypothetical protein
MCHADVESLRPKIGDTKSEDRLVPMLPPLLIGRKIGPDLT